ncbi:MAG: enoyl-CoA hydratase/isomerase family protein [Syntrophomonadaceae bacterium]|nr:enoyl-CoA hydratase/isomerase family protein [Syntrophomonadaceae bacterium]
MPDFEYYDLNVQGPLAYVTLKRPDRLNTLGLGPWKEIVLVQDEIEANPDIRVVIIKADGDHFSAGIDLHDLEKVDSRWVADNIHWLQRLNSRWQDMNPIVNAAVHGVCYGAAFEMIIACDIRIASEDARFSIPEVRFGLSPDMGGSQRLPRLVGPGQAKRLIIACDEIDAREAKEIGLVEIVVPRDQLYERAEKMAKRIINNPPWAVRFAKKAINASLDSSIAGGLLLEQIQSIFCCGTEDQNEAIRAFFEKRKPQFQGK